MVLRDDGAGTDDPKRELFALLEQRKQEFAAVRATVAALWEALEYDQADIAEFMWQATELAPCSPLVLNLYQREEQRLRSLIQH